jgi:endonuclease/exonuclease/phosphatase family metal-dependent hydrolase
MDLRLISYNTHCFPWTLTEIKEIVTWIVQTGNLVALQEVWCRHSEWAAAFAAHGWSFLRPARENHFTAMFGSGLAFAWPNSRWQLHDARQYPFLDAVGLDRFVVKGWFQLELTDSITGAAFRIINTHLQADLDVIGTHTQTIRQKQARQLLATLKHQGPRPTLIVGDLNSDVCQFAPYCFLQKQESRILDHCVALPGDGWILHDHRIIEKEWSDHHPVFWWLGAR